jgi:hypothetical protein
MSKKRLTQREVGFVQGIAYAAGLLAKECGHITPLDIIEESGLDLEEFKHAYEADLQLIRDSDENARLPRGK